MKKKVLQIFLLLILLLSVFSFPVFGEEKIVKLNSNNDLEAAVSSAVSGTIIDLGGQSFQITDHDSNDSPWAINNEVTIQNGTITLQKGGIILGADVTLKNVQLGFSNSTGNVIAANGYSLILDNATRAVTNTGMAATHQVHLVCGTMLDGDGVIGSTQVPVSGPKGSITIKGENIDLGNIYAGNLCRDFTTTTSSVIPAEINIYATGSLGMDYTGTPNQYPNSVDLEGGIYASGAIMMSGSGLTLDPNYIQCPPLPLEMGISVPVTEEDVVIRLGDGASRISNALVPYVNGETGGIGNTSVIFQAGDYSVNGVVFKNLSSLNIAKGSLAVGNESKLEETEIILSENGILSLIEFEDLGTAISSLKGGGILVLAQMGSLEILNGVEGNPTKVGIEGISYDGQNSTALPFTGHNYIYAEESKDGDFILLPYSNGSDQSLVRIEGSWRIPAEDNQEILVVSAEMEEEISLPIDNYGAVVPLTVEYTKDGGELGIIPLSILVGGYEARRTGDNIFGYSYSSGYGSKDLNFSIGLYEDEEGNLVEKLEILGNGDFDSIPAGNYSINITIPAKYTQDQKAITLSTVLKVADSTAEEECSNGHTQEYISNENTIIDSCTVCKEELGRAVIQASDITYDGNEHGANITSSGTLENEVWEIVYRQDEIILEGKPVHAGNYIASISKGTTTASAGFQIKPKALTEDMLEDGKKEQIVVFGEGEFEEPNFIGIKGEAIEGTLKYSVDSIREGSYETVRDYLKTKKKDTLVSIQWTFQSEEGNYTGLLNGTFEVTVKDIEFKVGNVAADETNAINLLTDNLEYGKTWEERIAVKDTAITASVGDQVKQGNYMILPTEGNVSDMPEVGTHSYSVIFSGDGYENVTVFEGTLQVTEKKVSIIELKVEDRAYDGTKTVKLLGGSISGKVNGDDLSIDLTSAVGMMEDANAGDGKKVEVSGVALKGEDAGNYILSEQPAELRVNISKLQAKAKGYSINILNNNADTYQFELSKLLPDPGNGKSYGAVNYTISSVQIPDYYMGNGTIQENKLYFPIAAVNTEEEKQVGSIRIKIVCDNYFFEDAVITVNSVNKNEDLPEEEISDGIRIYGMKEDLNYDGGKQVQAIQIYDGKTLLVENKDYTVSYKNNVNAFLFENHDQSIIENVGITLQNLTDNTDQILQEEIKTVADLPDAVKKKAPQMVIKMKGNYKGTITIYYEIIPQDIAADDILVNDLAVIYNKKKQTPTPVILWKGKKLSAKDFQVKEYIENKKNTEVFKGKEGEIVEETLTIQGLGNFTGERNITLTIAAKEKISEENKITYTLADKISVSGVKALTWDENLSKDGMKQEKEKLTIKFGKDIPVLGTEKELSEVVLRYEENQNPGTAYLILEGTGNDIDGDYAAYVGVKRISFKINGLPFNKVKVEVDPKGYVYTGNPIELFIENDVSAVKVTDANGNELHYGEHFTTAYTNNIKKGTATLTLEGIEEAGYVGVKKQSFKIIADTIDHETAEEKERFEISITDPSAENENGTVKLPFVKGGVKPQITVKDPEGKVLILGTDYTVSYLNNKNIAGTESSKPPTIEIKGKGNYTGTARVFFEIVPKDMNNEQHTITLKVDVKDKFVKPGETLKKNGWKSAVKILDQNGAALSAKEADIKNARYRVEKLPDSHGLSEEQSNLLMSYDTLPETLGVELPIGTIIRVEVGLSGTNYTGTATGTYRILETGHDIGKAVIKIVDQYYTGKEILIDENADLSQSTLKISNQETVSLYLQEEENYNKTLEVVPGSYIKNIDKGTAKVTFQGIGEYGGLKTVSFKIKERNVKEVYQNLYQGILDLF